MFIDIAKVKLKAGDGGNGCRSFYQRRNRRFSSPDGGNGGKGGDIELLTDSRIRTLLDFRFRQHFRAKNGGHGGSKRKKGKDAPDLVIKVPCGTVIREAPSGFLLRDLKTSGQELIAVKGGSGGRGNALSRSEAEKGALGQEREVTLELKLIADVAIIGLPNAGKSSLISCLTSCRPKIAAYPFTTKTPILGTYNCADFSFVLVDVPGLIEGAHLGKGLGDKFLRHIERTRMVLQIIDISGVSTVEPIDAYRIIDNELKLYGGDLETKQRIIVGNKIDLEGWQDNLNKLERQLERQIGRPVIVVSCLNRKGLEKLIDEIKLKL